jgi:L-fuculose-phosphate aldolase
MSQETTGQKDLRRRIIDAARALGAEGLSRGTSGNVSARLEDGFLITPSGMGYEALQPGDVAKVEWEDTPDETAWPRPSSEWRFHRDIYRARPEAMAIVHAHPPFATALACVHRAIPAFHYMVAAAGGRDIRCAAYATFGTQELSDNVIAGLEGRRACLMGNHGLVAFGPDLARALALAVEVENLAEQYTRALSVGVPVVLDDAEMDRVLVKFKAYGRKAD